ncbi:peptidyl-prolyl cis-trans isomerase [Muriicola sp.]|uniref:peptidylprolyl isomerase n=1 Tax=Muriicola sp. TaxID=2020856 RepID=UPI003C795EB1
MLKIFKEPLLQFLLIGVCLFVIYNWRNAHQNQGEIIIDSNTINEITAKYELQWNRNPPNQELVNLIDSYLEQEVLYREAILMNLDENDEMIKRRLAQKMEFLTDDVSASIEPNEEQLKTFYQNHKENYKKSSLFSLKQVYFNDQRLNPWEDAKLALKKGEIENSGDPISLPEQYTNTSASRLALDFGQEFSLELEKLPLNQWVGPVKSGFGVHLIFIKNKKSASYYDYDEVKNKVKTDYSFNANNSFKKELFARLLKKYTISIDVDDNHLKKILDEKY